ncbi:MAG: glycosyltransferase family 39 protein [Acidobacteriota bacterium]
MSSSSRPLPPLTAAETRRRGEAESPLRGPWLLVLLAITAVGSVLRFLNLNPQALGGDELHAVRAILEMGLPELLYTYRPQDGCLPLSSLYRAWVDLHLPLNEWVMRAPALLCGVLALIVLPRMAARRLGTPTALVFAALLATSPLLVLYSRIARSYMPVVLVAFAAVILCEHWLDTGGPQGGSRRAAIAYVLLAGFAVYLHLVTTAFVFAPLAYAALEEIYDALRHRQSWRLAARRLAPIAALGLSVGALMALFLVPGWESLTELVRTKRQSTLPNLGTFAGFVQLHGGSMRVIPGFLLLFMALPGLVSILRHPSPQRRRFGRLTVFLVLAHLGGLALLKPLMMHLPPQFARYNLVLLPVELLWASAGIAALWQRGPAPPWLRRGALVALALALVLTHPLTRWEYRSSAFTHHKDFLGFYEPLGTLQDADVPDFYRELESLANTTPSSQRDMVLEYPWHTSWRLSRTPYVLQNRHRHPLLLAPTQPEIQEPSLSFRNLITVPPPQAPEVFLSSEARWLVVFRDRGALEEKVQGDHRSPERGWKARGREWKVMKKAGPEMAQRLTAAWGPPHRQERDIVVWDLEELRSLNAAEVEPRRKAP